MPANSLNAASADWSAEPAPNMRSLPLSTRGSTWLLHIFTTDAIFRLVAFTIISRTSKHFHSPLIKYFLTEHRFIFVLYAKNSG